MKDPRKPIQRRRFNGEASVQARRAGQKTQVYRPQRIGKDQAQGHHH